MNFETFPNCCGMQEIGGFYGNAQAIKGQIRQHLDQLETDRNNKDDSISDFFPGGLIATTTPNQKAAITALKYFKFRNVFTFTNPGTGHKITLWAKKLVK